MTLYSGTHNCVCRKMLNNGLNHGLFLSLFKLIPCHIHLIVCMLVYLNLNIKAVLALAKMAGSALTHKNISFIWIVWRTLGKCIILNFIQSCCVMTLMNTNLNSMHRMQFWIFLKGHPVDCLKKKEKKISCFKSALNCAVWRNFFCSL